jgi:DNA (cytosine-5)-methyltransferase 1
VTHLDLFSGIGGFALAAEWAGIRTVGFAEIDPFACSVLARQFPGIPNFGNVALLHRRSMPVLPDLITAGFPCQPYSKIGKRKSSDDSRDLWPETRRLLQDFRPTWFLGENVAGIVKLALDGVWADLEALGYSCQPLAIPAGAVGAPHRRERIWILANTQCPRLEGHTGDVPSPTGWEAPHGPTGPCSLRQRPHGWGFEPNVGRVAPRLPHRVDRIRALGNSIVPQVAYEILVTIKQLHDKNRPFQSQALQQV